MTDLTKPNWQEARRFAELIARTADPITCIQVFDDKAKNDFLGEHRHGRLTDKALQKWIVVKAKSGCGIYFTINETDGLGRTRAHITKARALAVDLDKKPLPKTFALRPSLITQSSPGRHWLFWLIEPTDDLNAWPDAQARLAAFYGGDPKIVDPPRVCRLPGFDHQKGDPFRSRIIAADEFEVYTLAEVAAAHPCEYNAPAPRSNEGRSDEPEDGWDSEDDLARARAYLTTVEPPTEGDRNNQGYRVACVLNDFGISAESSFDLMSEVWNPRLDGPLPDNEIRHVIKSATRYKHSSAGSKSTVNAADEFTDETAFDFEGEKKFDFEGNGNALVPVEERGLTINEKSNIAPDTIANAYAAVVGSGLVPAWDELKQNTVFRTKQLPWDETYGRVVNDHVVRLARLYFVNQWQGVAYQPSLDNLLNAIVTIAYAQKFNPVLEYLTSLKWDGVKRIQNLFGAYFNCGLDDYTRAVSHCFMIGAVRRMRRPGSKFDTMPILKGPQGWDKSTGVKTLFGEDFWSDANLGSLRDKDAALKLRGIWVQEFAEVDSLTRAETNVLKHFCSLQFDRQRDPYGRITENSPRRCVFIATVNEGGYLKDPTGARRFWPLEVSKPVNIADLRRDRDQLWAEAAALEAQGASDVLPKHLWGEAGERAAEQTTEDPWADDVRVFLEGRAEAYRNWKPNDEGEPRLPADRVHAAELFDALAIKTEGRTKGNAQRLRTVMEATLGWHHRKCVRIGGRVMAGYVKT